MSSIFLGSLVFQLNRFVRGLVAQIARTILHLVEGGLSVALNSGAFTRFSGTGAVVWADAWPKGGVGGLMPLSWARRRDGGQASASPGTDRKGIPEGRGYTSAHVGRGPDSERPKRHYLFEPSATSCRVVC
jgi:hypothetical protein